MNKNKFNEWLEEYKPLPKEILGDTYPKAVQGMSFTTLHAYRYRFTLEKLIQSVSVQPGDHLLDIGPYPGGWASLLYKHFNQHVKIDLMGLGITTEFMDRYNSENINFIEYDIDTKNPICKNPNQKIPLKNKHYKVVSMLETIEHLYDPLPILNKIQESITKDGILIITTDNPSWFGFAYQILRYRRSPWGPVKKSHIFVKNDWRAHFRLYNIQDLTILLEHTGFQVINSNYFNDNSGLYRLKKGEFKYRFGIKPMLTKLVSWILPGNLWANRVMIIAKRKSE